MDIRVRKEDCSLVAASSRGCIRGMTGRILSRVEGTTRDAGRLSAHSYTILTTLGFYSSHGGTLGGGGSCIRGTSGVVRRAGSLGELYGRCERGLARTVGSGAQLVGGGGRLRGELTILKRRISRLGRGLRDIRGSGRGTRSRGSRPRGGSISGKGGASGTGGGVARRSRSMPIGILSGRTGGARRRLHGRGLLNCIPVARFSLFSRSGG